MSLTHNGTFSFVTYNLIRNHFWWLKEWKCPVSVGIFEFKWFREFLAELLWMLSSLFLKLIEMFLKIDNTLVKNVIVISSKWIDYRAAPFCSVRGYCLAPSLPIISLPLLGLKYICLSIISLSLFLRLFVESSFHFFLGPLPQGD